MASLHQHLSKLREERIAREKARIEKLRELNLKKYSKTELLPMRHGIANSSVNKSSNLDTAATSSIPNSIKSTSHGNGALKKPIANPHAYGPRALLCKNLTYNAKCRTIVNNSKPNIPNDKLNAELKKSHIDINKTNIDMKVVEKNDDTEDKHATTIEKGTEIVEKPTAVVEKSSEIVENSTKVIEQFAEATKSITNEQVTIKTADKVVTGLKNKANARKSLYIGNMSSFSSGPNSVNGQSKETRKPKPKDFRKSIVPPKVTQTVTNNLRKSLAPPVITQTAKTNLRKSLAPPKVTQTVKNNFRKSIVPPNVRQSATNNFRKTIVPPKVAQSASKAQPNRQSVFERLYQPRIIPKKAIDEVKKLQTDPLHLRKMINNAALILNKRHTNFELKRPVQLPMRRSISAIHYKRIEKSEASNCIHKWSSMGERLDKVHLDQVNEDDTVKQDKVVSAIKSERKKVKFQTPVTFNLNTPKPEDLQARLKTWLQKRGKSINSYQHLQCFGIDHLPQKLKPMNLEETTMYEEYDDENKENVPLESDSDNGSYVDNMGNDLEDRDLEFKDGNKWRRASFVSDSVVDFNETRDSTLTSAEKLSDIVSPVDELLLGTLNDLTELLREGFDWDQCARWLRAVRERFPSAADSAAYWECRAALEETRGDLPTTIQCWEEAIAKGTERSVVDANLDNLLVKFMQLEISPKGARRQTDSRLVDVKNIFKSTIIRFAVQQAKLRQTSNPTPTKYICTPVRRSGRLSTRPADARTPLRVCASVKQAERLGHPMTFVPNDRLCGTP